MREILKKAKIPLIIIMVLVIGFFVYNTVLKKDPPSDELSDAESGEGEDRKAPNQDFLPLLNLIKGVSFDEKFFDDALFRSLIDFSEPVKEEQKGRDNPFAPGIVTTFANTSAVGATFEASATSTVPTASSTRPATTASTTIIDR
jgi:hypothetical protein